MLSKNDLSELRRLSTNAYDGDKQFVNRVINEFSRLENEVKRLESENKNLKKQLDS